MSAGRGFATALSTLARFVLVDARPCDGVVLCRDGLGEDPRGGTGPGVQGAE
jgi:hypothetical protein